MYRVAARNPLNLIFRGGLLATCRPLSCGPRLRVTSFTSSCSRTAHTTTALPRRSYANLSYFHEVNSTPLQSKTIGDVIRETTERHPDQEYVVFSADGIRRTFRHFKDEVDRLAMGLVEIGVRGGDRVGIWGPNSLEWLITQYAVASIGAILVNVNPACRPAELHHILSMTGVKVLVSATTFKTQDYYDMIAQLCPHIRTARPGKLKSQRLPDFESVVLYGDDSQPGAYVFDDVMSMESDESVRVLDACMQAVQSDHPSNILFTSGTTGLPKGATLTHHCIVNNMYFKGRVAGWDQMAHVFCAPVPFCHLFGTVLSSFCTMIFGNTFVVPSPTFEPGPSIRAIQEEKCTVVYGTPTMFMAMLHHESVESYDLSSVHSIFTGASPVPQELLRLAQRIMGPEQVLTGYGMTEHGLSAVTRRTDTEERRLATTGKVAPHLEVKIVDPVTQNIVPVDSPGEVCVRGYAVMRGYWGQPDKTKEAIDENRWFHTGDLATLDVEGYLKIVGRIKDVIIRGGSNIYPAELENFLHTHPCVQEAQVIGVPDSAMIEEVCAVLLLKPGTEATEQDIKSFCKGQISHYKIPRYVRFVDKYPLTVSGKIQKFKLKEQFKNLEDDKHS